MNSLIAFGMMAGAGIISAFIYDIFCASRRAMEQTVSTKKKFKRLRVWSRPIGDFLSVTCACLIFLIAAYFCAAGNLRSYIILGFLCGIVFYAGCLTHITGNIVYGIMYSILRILRLLLWRIPKRIFRFLRRRKNVT